MKNFLTGILAGLAVGYLTAPSRGKDTRKKLTDVLGEQSWGVKDHWNKTVAQARQTVEKVKTQAGNLAHQVEDQLGAAADKMTSQKEPVNKPVNTVADQTQAGIDNAQDALKID